MPLTNNAFVALDFETANGKRTSICSVGMVKVIDNQITESFHTLINPQDYFSKKNINVHGINPEDVIHAPQFDYVFPYMLQFIANLPVVAHNAAFDMNVLHQSLKQAGIITPDLTYFCSYQLAKRTIDAPRYALNDAKACAMITFRLLQHYDDLATMLSIYGKNLKDKG